MNLSQDIIQKFREEYLTSLPPIIDRASTVRLSHRWDGLFQCSITPRAELISPDLLSSMLDLYQVPSFEQLLPKYLGEDAQWGGIVSPRVANITREPIAYVEQWFVSDPGDLKTLIEAIKTRWPFPFAAIWIPLSPRHRCASILPGWESARLAECAYVADWGCTRPDVPSVTKFNQFSCALNQGLDEWWPDLFQELNRDISASKADSEISSLKNSLESCLRTGGILTLHDVRGMAAVISWARGSDAELLIPQCWNIPCIFVRPDLRGQGLAKHLYALASQNMLLEENPFMCARVHGENQASCKALESVGAERVMEIFTVE
ncbi:hypothetical protein [Candidatus Nitronereus thalassa]|uniref:N-acetyltransferase domain-containing protein n=1 Tax=Candidatus Nitronereus thalassa TaxID=3020898 RepID=A0ABU3KB05_9BACT|nr:hypothetical protein [Candidatus Nitronereus thalassa]MDT7043532.1 hypothetical protein [Candidatus Nitronereus thalassa]